MFWNMNHVKHLFMAAMLMSSMLSLTAAEINPPFQQFATGSDFNLEGSTLSFSPNGRFESYSFCTEKQDGFLVSTFEAEDLNLDDDEAAEFDFKKATTIGFDFPFFGEVYDKVHVSSNGYISFEKGESDVVESANEFFSASRVALFATDLDPSRGGQVSAKVLTKHLLSINFVDVETKGGDGKVTFQVLLHCDGKIQVYYDKIDVGSQPVLVGLSNGAQPSRIAAYDLSGCGDMPIPTRAPPPTSAPTPAPSPAPTMAPVATPAPTTPMATTPTSPPVEQFCGFPNCETRFAGPWCSGNQLRCESSCSGMWCTEVVEPQAFVCGSPNTGCQKKMGPWCSNDQGRCETSCGGEWCPDKPGNPTPAPTTPAPTTPAPTTPPPTDKRDVFFCGKNSQCQDRFTGNFCKSTEVGCNACGGEWCKEEEDPDRQLPGVCGYRQCTKLAGPWCNADEERCIGACKGTWCPA